MCGGSVGAFVTQSFALPLVALLGRGNQKAGFMWGTAIFGVIGVLLFFYAYKHLAYKHLKEVNVATTKPIPFKDSLKAAKGNFPWFILVAAFVIFWIAQSDRNGIAAYYAKYNLGNVQLASIFNGVGITGMIATMCIPFLVRKTNKTATMLIGLIIACVGQIGFAFVGNNLVLAVILWIVTTMGAAIACAQPFGMLADTVDYGEWKNGIHAAGFLTAVGSAFCIQLGSGLGSFIPSKIMAAAGFVANKTQTASALGSIRFCFIWLPVIVYVISGLIMCLYFKYEKNEPKIQEALKKRHAEALAKEKN